MPNEHLVDQLASSLKPVRRRSFAADASTLLLLCAIELCLFLGLGFMRPDMPMAMALPSFWWKLGSVGLITLVGGCIAVLSFDPTASPRPGLRWLMALVVLCLAAGWIVDASRDSLPNLAIRLDWRSGLQCVYKMVLLSVPAI